MKKGVRRMVVASMAALCALGASFSTSAYELNPEVKDVTPALREASTVGVWTSENPAMKNAPNKDAILVMTFGTTFKDTRAKTIDAVEKAIQEAILGYLYMKLIPPISSSIESRQRKEFRS